jgi:enamine deaminase RidA (YjgF/YER057c/UK114 family)
VTHDRPVPSGIEFVRPAGLAGTSPYAYAAVTDPGRMAFTAGACPLDADGATVAVGDVAGQARQVMANLVTALEGVGAGLCDVLKTTVYVATTERNDLVAAWDVVRGAFGDHDAPSTLVGVTVLGHPDQLVEVEAVAVLDSWREPAPPHDGPGEDA